MKIEKIKIENFRGILDAELEFDSQLNVFIGGNGAGKTTMLRAILQTLFKFTDLYLKNPRKHINPSFKDIRYKSDYFLTTSILKLKNSEAKIPLTNYMGDVPKQKKNSIEISKKQLKIIKEDFDEKFQIGHFTIPIVKYYPSPRVMSVHTNYSYNKFFKIPQLETWFNLYQDNLSYYRLLNWFFEEETEELRLKRDKRNFNIESKELGNVRKAIQFALKILFKKNYIIKSNKVKWENSKESMPTLTLENIQTGESEDLNAKSDGEKAIITLVADIAYNLSIAKDFSEGNDYLSSPGIVLIDEIEAHLHPNWQREIIPLLTQLFPNIQFFITTHSPQILSSVESQHVFICEDFEFSKINIKSKGLDSNSLLKYVFNSTERPKKYVELIEKFDSIIEEEGEIEELQAIITEIKALNSDDKGQDIDLLVNDLNLQIEAYKFDLAHEID